MKHTIDHERLRGMVWGMFVGDALAMPVHFLRAYVAFMMTPDSHNDTYAESCHRDFFANHALGVSPERCAGAEGHDTASIGGLVALPPVIVAAMREDDPAAVDRTLLAHLRLTHRSAKLERFQKCCTWRRATQTILRPPWSLARMWAEIIVTAARCWAQFWAHRWAMGRSPHAGSRACAVGPNFMRKLNR